MDAENFPGNEKEKLLSDKQKLEVELGSLKEERTFLLEGFRTVMTLLFDFFKHLSSLSGVAILIIIGFFNSPSLTSDTVIVKIAVYLFTASLAISLLAMLLIVTGLADFYLTKKVKSIILWVAAVVASCSFAVGVSMLAQYVTKIL